MLKIVDETGKVFNIEVIMSFTMANKNYLLYSLGELDSNNMETLHASEIVNENNAISLKSVETDMWNNIKEMMRDIVRNEGK